MTKKNHRATDGAMQSELQEPNGDLAVADREPAEQTPASNASIMMLAGGFLAAMFIVVAAEFVRHQF
ncbi:MAG: hypothetical protein KJ587_13940 [Alphaproteobacteria bacterium]|nr:hypothetical protein [Alphaproteobacteria bacterium]